MAISSFDFKGKLNIFLKDEFIEMTSNFEIKSMNI